MRDGGGRRGGNLRVRLTAWYGAVMGAMLGLFALLLYVLLALNLSQELDRALSVRGAAIATILQGDEWAADSLAIRQRGTASTYKRIWRFRVGTNGSSSTDQRVAWWTPPAPN